MAIGRIRFSTLLESISTRSSVRNPALPKKLRVLKIGAFCLISATAPFLFGLIRHKRGVGVDIGYRAFVADRPPLGIQGCKKHRLSGAAQAEQAEPKMRTAHIHFLPASIELPPSGLRFTIFVSSMAVSFDFTGAAALLGCLPKAEWLLADRGYDADWFREALKDKGIKPCIPGRKSRGKPIRHDKLR